MPKIKLFNDSDLNVDDKINEFNLTQAKLHLPNYNFIIGFIKGNSEEKLLEKYETLVATALLEKKDKPFEFATTKSKITKMDGNCNAAIKIASAELSKDIKNIAKGRKNDNGTEVNLYQSFLEKNISTELVIKDYYIIDELFEIRSSKNEMQTKLLKDLVNSDQFDFIEFNNPMERALLNCNKKEILDRVVVLDEYVSARNIKNSIKEVKYLNEGINSLNNYLTNQKEQLEPNEVIQVTDSIKNYEERLDKITSTIDFSMVVFKIQEECFKNDMFKTDLEDLRKHVNFDKNETITALTEEKSFMYNFKYGSVIYQDKKWFAIDTEGVSLVSENGVKSFEQARDSIIKSALKNAIILGNTNNLEDLLENYKAKVELISTKDITNCQNPENRVEIVEIITEAIDHNNHIGHEDLKEKLNNDFMDSPKEKEIEKDISKSKDNKSKLSL